MTKIGRGVVECVDRPHQQDQNTQHTDMCHCAHRTPIGWVCYPLELSMDLVHPVYVSPLLCVSSKSVIEENRLRMVLNVCIQKIRAKIEYRTKLNIYRPPCLVLYTCLAQGYPLHQPVMRQTVRIDAVCLEPHLGVDYGDGVSRAVYCTSRHGIQ